MGWMTGLTFSTGIRFREHPQEYEWTFVLQIE